MRKRNARYSMADLLLVIVACGLVIAFLLMIGEWTRDRFSIGQFCVLFFAYVLWVATWSKRRGPYCQECGQQFARGKDQREVAICPTCRKDWQYSTDDQRQRIGRILVLGILLVLIAAALCESVWGFANRNFRANFWIALLVLTLLGLVGVLLTGVLGILTLAHARSWLFWREESALACARKCTGQQERRADVGPLTVFGFGDLDPVPILTDQWTRTRGSFERFTGEQLSVIRPTRVITFSDHCHFVAFLRGLGADAWSLEGIFAAGRPRSLLIVLRSDPHRLTDTPVIVRRLATYCLIDTLNGFLPRSWLLQGVANCVASSGGAADFARLNRKNILALNQRTAFRAELFRLTRGKYAKLLFQSRTFDSHKKCVQINAQSWSVVEYLAGARASADRRTAFQAFFKALPRRGDGESLFKQHFGYGYDKLLDDWAESVRSQGLGTHQPPPAAVQAVIQDRVIPTIWNHRAKIMDRVQAVRDMGQMGWAFGAESLIELLRRNEDFPRREVVWALESISGLPYGADVRRWTSWWESLPADAAEGEVLAEWSELGGSANA
jgi:hypothetical protein